MYGIGATLWQFIVTAKPWQRMVAGLVVVAVGVLLGNYVLTAFGVVFVILPAAGWIRRRRGAGVEEPDVGGVESSGPEVPVEADAG